jgi:RNA polymerase sigma factor (TIGR02999 family)
MDAPLRSGEGTFRGALAAGPWYTAMTAKGHSAAGPAPPGFKSGVLMNDVTRILTAIDGGDPQAAERLLPLVYDELRKLAAQRMAQEKPGQTLQATALVHEAWLRLVGSENEQKWDSRGHFFAAAAEAMRRILIDRARHKATEKAGGQRQHLTLVEDVAAPPENAFDLLALDDALNRLAEADKVAADLVKLRYFAGLTVEQAAEALGMSPRSAYYAWNYARSWLRRAIRGE